MAEAAVLDEKTARILPWIVAVAFFMQLLDGTILNTALPAVAASLNVNPLQMQGAIISYMLTVAMLIPASGWLADRFGTRTIFLTAIFLFSLGSLSCALSFSLEMLVASRILQGLGGALLLPVGRLVVLKAYPRNQLVEILSFVTIPGLLGPLVGPTLGGFIVEYASWEWIFLINLPVGVLGAVAAWYFMPNMIRKEELGKFDKTGFILFGSFMFMITIALDSISEARFGQMEILLLFAIGIASLIAYCFHARKEANAVFRTELFQTRSFAVGITGNLFARLGMGAIPFLTPLLLQIGLGFHPSKAGMTMIPITAGAICMKKALPPLINRLGYRRLLLFNTFILGGIIACFSLLDRDTPYIVIILFFFVFGLCNSSQFTAMNAVTLVELPDRDAGSGNSLLSVVMQLSMSLGVASAAGILSRFSAAQTVDILNAFHKTYLFLGFLTAISTPVFLYLRSSRKLSVNPG